MAPIQDNKWEFCSRDYAQAGSIGAGSSTWAPGFPASHVIDGDRLTCFKAVSLPATLIVDLGQSLSVDRVGIECPAFFGVKEMALSFSTNGTAYTALPFSAYGNLRRTICKFPRQSMRYMQIQVSALPDGVSDLRIATVSIFRVHFVCDGYTDSLGKAMPFNPASRSIEWGGKVMVPLLHGANYRVQTWGAERRKMRIVFPDVKREVTELLEWYADRGVPFGVMTHDMVFHNLIIPPGGLRVNEEGSDGPGVLDPILDRLTASKGWYSVELDVQEVAAAGVIADEEPPTDGEGILMTETGVV